MLAMQYSISLPADYEMKIIRDRVARRGPMYDTLEHLGFKAFLITEKGKTEIGRTATRHFTSGRRNKACSISCVATSSKDLPSPLAGQS